MLGEIFGGLMNMGIGALNNYWSRENTKYFMAENYKYNEQAAENADKRTRALYQDFYSPEALLSQYQEAGLSPSIMFGGTPGQGGMSGAQGAGAQGMQAQYMPLSMLEGAQMANIAAQTEKVKAETKNIDKDTDLKKIEEAVKNMDLQQYQNEWSIVNSTWEINGKPTSIFEMATEYYNYDEFLNACRDPKTDERIRAASTTEAGQKQLRNIFEGAQRFHRDIMVLSQESVSASFQMEIIQKLQDQGFTNLNAEAACAQMRSIKAASELTESQKDAWNNLIDRLGKKGSTMRDIVVVLGMLIGNFTSHSGVKINLGNK